MSNFTKTDLASVNRAIASGELTVRFQDTSTTYRSMDELFKAKRMIEEDLAAADRSTPTYAVTSRGLR